MKLSELRKLYFLGIGGIGMSAIARYFLNEGVEIHGYDLANTSLTKKLEAEGMHIHYDINPDKIPRDIDGVIMTPAIPEDHRELTWINENGYSIKKRAEVLGLLSKEKKSIAVAGTHGKTTTSSLISHILTYCGLDITAFLGGILSEQNSNFLCGKSDWVILEADEYDRSFLQLNPDVLVILSMDADHLDIYGTHAEMLKAYEQLCTQIKQGGKLIIEKQLLENFSDDFENVLKSKDIELVGIGSDFKSDNIQIQDARYHFDYQSKNLKIDSIRMQLPGQHNIFNASIAIYLAQSLGCKDDDIKAALKNFKGIRRRFEWVLDAEKVLVDDYAHHPEEVKHAVHTIKKLYPDRKVLGIFQPHLFSRTQDFYHGFAEELSQLDEVWLLQIYPAREEPIEGVASELIYNLIPKDKKRILHTDDLIEELKNKKDLEVVMTIGAADLDKYHNQMIEILKEKH